MKRFLRWWCLACSLHFFGAYHSYFSFLTDSANRQIYLWGRLDWLYGLGSILAMGLAGALAGLAASRGLPGGSRGKDFQRLFFLYALATTWTFFANASLSDPLPSLASSSALAVAEGSAKLALLGLAGWAAIRFPARLAKVTAAFFLILSPTILLFFLQAAAYKTFRPSSGPLPPASPAAMKGPRVYLILFDAWSYERTFENGQPRPELPNLRKLADRSLVLHSAFSPRTLTLESVPRLLSLKPLGLVTQEHMVRGHDMSQVLAENLFLLARTIGFSSYIVGSHIPYPDWFRRDAAYASTVSHYKPVEAGPRLAHVLWMINRDGLLMRLFGLKSRLDVIHAESVAGLNLDRVHAGALKLLAATPPRSFSFVHYPIPHSPVAVPDRGSAAADADAGPADQYYAMIKVVDREIGEIRAALEASGQWDDSLVIITTDHAVRIVDGPETAICHIPVFIKLPGQANRLDSRVPFDTRRLRGVVAAAMRGGVSARTLRESPEIKRLLTGAGEPVKTCGPLPYPPL